MKTEAALFYLGACVIWYTFAPCHGSLECFQCTNVTDLTDCRTTTMCQDGTNCYTERRGLGSDVKFTLGCKVIEQCHNSGGPMVGREIQTRETDCSQCCAVGYCNKQLCTNVPTAITGGSENCADDPSFNCELVGGTFNICGDIQHAKLVCRKWCGLCHIVDGAWTQWSQYSSCDVTCGEGRRVRNRTCTNPAPSNGGLDCVGTSTEVEKCQLDVTCPVHGGWSGWSDWGGCSQTCGVGLQRRTRTCSNPPPSLFGDHCFGDSLDDKVCFQRACVDGNWGPWGAWGNCTSGLRSRTRVCDSPAPSQFGHECVGNNEDKTLCEDINAKDTNISFAANSPDYNLVNNSPIFKTVTKAGNLFNQTTGSCTCTVSGLYLFTMKMGGTRKGGYCYIKHNDVTIAYTEVGLAGVSVYVFLIIDDTVTLNCGEWGHVYVDTSTSYSGDVPNIYFAVNSPNAQLNDHHPTFKQINNNIGNFYDPATGICTCEVPGLYQFSMSLKGTGHSQYTGYCYITKNGVFYVYAKEDSGVSVLLNLVVNDTASLYCGGWQAVDQGIATSFSGALIHT